MAVDFETRTRIDTRVTQLLEQFLAGIVGGLVSEEVSEQPPSGEVVLCEVQVEGIRYKLTCQPCLGENDPHLSLSPREQEIIRLVMKGFSTRGIAKVLEISPWTVTTHLRRVFSKLSVNSRAEMVACVMREGMLLGTVGDQSPPE